MGSHTASLNEPPTNSVTRLLVHSARAHEKVPKNRARILQRVLLRDEAIQTLPGLLERKLFHLKGGAAWKLFDFSDRDWPLLARTLDATDIMEANLLSMVLTYIRVNRERVIRLQDVSDRCSDVLLGAPESLSDGAISNLDSIDRQSLFVFRVQGGTRINRFSEFVDYLRDAANSIWVRRVLLNPFTYYALSTPTDDYIDTFLSYMVPSGKSAGIERMVVRHILREDLSLTRSLALRAYLALASHPYDAFDSLVSYLETQAAREEVLSSRDQATLEELSRTIPCSRASRLLDYLSVRYLRVAEPEGVSVSTLSTRIPDSARSLVDAFVDCESSVPDLADLPSDLWRSLARMRWSRYPEESDFISITGSARTWAFLDGGRLFAALLSAMYMVTRADELVETRHLNRLHAAVRRSTPFLWGAPRGFGLLRRQMRADPRAWLGADLHAGAALRRRAQAEDRSWFSSAHWELQKHERVIQVRKWLAEIRARFHVRPRYLTGIDWSWLDKVIPICRVAPFQETADGPLALLLRDIEQQSEDPTMLRTALEVQVQGRGCRDFTNHLIATYGIDAPGFVRFFLTPENILTLGLAPNMTAALSDRIEALELCASRIGFGELLSLDQLEAEQKTLTASLMLLNISSAQFDVPWSSFARDAVERQKDSFEAHIAFRNASKALEIATDLQTPYPFRYVNGRAIEYVMRSSRINLGVFIIGVVDAFYDHPSYGLEAILSTRFRHDTLRREVKSALDELASSYIPGVTNHDQEEVIGRVGDPALEVVDDWLFRRMQTVRPGAPDALFDFVPTQEQLGALMIELEPFDTVEGAVEKLSSWLLKRLDDQLDNARQGFAMECFPRVLTSVERSRKDVALDGMIDSEVSDKVASGIVGALTRRFEQLGEWFRTPADAAQPELSYFQIKQAVDGRFEQPVSTGKLEVQAPTCAEMGRAVPAHSVRLFFDLLSEVYNNALKYSGLEVTRVTMSAGSDEGNGWTLEIISDAAPGECWNEAVEGHPYISVSEAITREGNSGLAKISSLAATLRQEAGVVTAERRAESFSVRMDLP